MPDTFLGIGSKEYGRRDVEPDGSYVTTKFLVLFFFPFWPMETRRVRYRIDKHIDRIDIRRYKLKRLPFCWRQITKVLSAAFAILLASIFVLAFLLPAVLSGL